MTDEEMNKIKKDLGKRIRAMREEKSLTAAELARACGIRRTYLANIESGNHSVRLSRLKSIARGLGMTLAQLVDDVF